MVSNRMQLLLQLQREERATDFSWDVDAPDDTGLRSLLEDESPSVGWVYDHIPKTGGSDFAGQCMERLDPLDHVFVPWPGSVLSLRVGRVLRASIVHGHGALAAAALVDRGWQTAFTLREPAERIASVYQQWARSRPSTSADSMTFTSWLRQMLEASDREHRLNHQVQWLAERRTPSLAAPYHCLARPLTLEAAVERAGERLAQASIVAETHSVRAVFQSMVDAADLRVRPDRSPEVVNASWQSSEALLSDVPPALRAELEAATEADRDLLHTARSHPGWLDTAASSQQAARPALGVGTA